MTIAEQLTQREIQQGEIKMLIKQLEYRFGKLSPPCLDAVRNADTETLLSWGKNIRR